MFRTLVRKTKRVLIVHEAYRTYGIGAELSTMISEELFGELKAPAMRLGAKQCPPLFSLGLENAVVPQESEILGILRSMVKK